MNAREDQIEVVKWYTRARRFPQLIGKTPDGARLWGGPYTYTQIIGGVTVLVVGIKTVGIWGQFGLVGDALLLLGLAYVTTLGLGRLPIGSRNPLSVAQGALRSFSVTPSGSYAGRPLKIRRPHRATSRLVITPIPPTGHVPGSETSPARDHMQPAPSSPERSQRGPRQGRSRRSPQPPAATSTPTSPPPDVDPTPAAQTPSRPALSNVQRLLASAGPTQPEE